MMTANSQQMNFPTKELVKKLEENRIKHVTEYEEAWQGYMEKIGEVLKDEIKKYKSGKHSYENGLKVSLAAPQSYEKEYTTVIEMLKMCADETILLDRQSFLSYVMDEWQWKHSFAATTSFYNSKGAM